MKSIICSILIGLFLVAVFTSLGTDAFPIDSMPQDELNRRLYVPGAMSGNNITLVSNSSIGNGAYGVVLLGEVNDGTPVAIKAVSTEYLKFYTQEYNCYEKMNATMDKVCEKYGIPFIYDSGDFLNYKTMAMTKLDFTLLSLQSKIGSFSRDSILIIFRDMIKTLKFIHSKQIINRDIKEDNIMTKGANVFLMDFNLCVDKRLKSHTHKLVWTKGSFEHIDLEDLFDVMSTLAETEAYCEAKKILNSDDGISVSKRQMKEELLKEMKHTELIEPYVEFCFEAVAVLQEKRLPKYDYFYKWFDDLLYAGRNRSERIVFEWLTPEEKAAAMAESIPSIESIVFPDEKSH